MKKPNCSKNSRHGREWSTVLYTILFYVLRIAEKKKQQQKEIKDQKVLDLQQKLEEKRAGLSYT